MPRIVVRDDDVLLPSRAYADPLAQFKQVHKLIVKYDALHRPAILCGEIEKFPGAIEYVNEQTANGTMDPQLHGLLHVQYKLFTETELREDLTRCVEWFETNLHRKPEYWYSPWGKRTELLTGVAAELGMKLIDASSARHFEPHKITSKEYFYSIDVGDQLREMFIHWWGGLNRLELALKVLTDA